jgi:hypothetical protein
MNTMKSGVSNNVERCLPNVAISALDLVPTTVALALFKSDSSSPVDILWKGIVESSGDKSRPKLDGARIVLSRNRKCSLISHSYHHNKPL